MEVFLRMLIIVTVSSLVFFQYVQCQGDGHGLEPWSHGLVRELDDVAFQEAIESAEPILVAFLAARCRNCNLVNAELLAAAIDLSTKDPPVITATIDAVKYAKIGKKYNIKKVPTLILFHSGTAAPYHGPRNAKAIVSHVSRLVSPDVVALSDENQLQTFIASHINEDLSVFVGFGMGPTTVVKVAQLFKSKTWFATFDNVTDSIMYKYDFDKAPALIAMHSLDHSETFYGPFDDGQDLTEFVRLNHLPPIMILDESTYERVVRCGRPIVIIIADFDSQAPTNIALDKPVPHQVSSPGGEAVRFVRKFQGVARRFRHYLFTYMDASQHPSFIESFGMSSSDVLPAIVVWNGGIQYYKLEDVISLDGLDVELHVSQFLHDIDSKKLKPRRTKQASWQERMKQAAMSSQFPLAVGVVLIALAIKFGRKGGNVLLPKLNFVAKKREQQQQALDGGEQQEESSTEQAEGEAQEESEMSKKDR